MLNLRKTTGHTQRPCYCVTHCIHSTQENRMLINTRNMNKSPQSMLCI